MNEWKQVTAAECKAWALEHPMEEYRVYERQEMPTLARFNPDKTIVEGFDEAPNRFEFFCIRLNEWSWDPEPFYEEDTYFIPEVTE